MSSQEANEYIRKYYNTYKASDIARATGLTLAAVQNRAYRLGLKKQITLEAPKNIEDIVAEDIQEAKKRQEQRDQKRINSFLLQENERLKLEIEALLHIQNPTNTYKIQPKKSSGSSEATAIIVASDWHIEEPVKPELVSGLNEYDLDISKARSILFFQNALRLVRICEKDVSITSAVLALLGDFITNSIHEDSLEDNLLSPVDAVLRCREYIVSGIEFILNNSKLELYIPCHTGNHGRTTKERRVATESGNSLEKMMYASIASHFRSEKRVKFFISDGYHSYLDLYGSVIRFHHGHSVSYGGGVGGVTIPVRKAIAQWQRGRRADLDIFGHFHQFIDGGNFIVNGSMIGYNAYALSIKAEFEKPKQAFFLWDKKRGKTIVAPILFE